ncbi:hypothetical protein ACYJ1Y_16960 [Natrialbaceae archaeon A-gly3]
MNPTDVADVIEESANNVADPVAFVLTRVRVRIVVVSMNNWQHPGREVNVVSSGLRNL